MPTQSDYDRFRADVNTTDVAFPDGNIDDLFAEAGESYTDAGVIKAQTRVIYFQRVKAGTIFMHDYTQNDSRHNLSQIPDNVDSMLEYWEGQRDDAVKKANRVGGAFRVGRSTRKPAIVREVPGGETWR